MPQEIEHMQEVDANPRAHTATVPNEEQILKEAYGEPDADGIYRGEEVE